MRDRMGNMSADEAKSPLPIMLAPLIFTCIVTLAYFTAYFAIGKRGTVSGPSLNGEGVIFSYQWQVVFFAPATEVESLVRGEKIHVVQWDVR
jgi:hypothetical protein